MTQVNYRQTINAPLDDTWAVVGDFGSLLDWVRGGNEGSIELSGSGPGMLRDLVLPAVGHVQHRLDVLDDEAHRITYSLTSGKPLGMVEYSVTARLIPGGEGTDEDCCTIEWAGEFVAAPDAELEGVADGLEDAYRGMSQLLDELLTRQRTQRGDES
jgi:GNAT superfamily N-acetyltransferase